MTKSINDKQKCIAIIGSPNGDTIMTSRCDNSANCDGGTCKFHKYYASLTNGEQKRITDWVNGDKSIKVTLCKRCKHFVFNQGDPNKILISECSNCKQVTQKRRDATQESNDAKKCDWYDKHGDSCRNYKVDDTSYCKYHEYVSDYTEEEKDYDSCGSCPRCHLWVYQGKSKLCPECKEDGKQYRAQTKKNSSNCMEMGCPDKAKKEGFCTLHWLTNWKKSHEKNGDKKVCSSYKRGCRSVLDIKFKYNKCDSCREKEREIDQRMRIKKKGTIDRSSDEN